MAQEHESVIEMWKDYLISIGQNIVSTDLKYNSWHFCDNEKDADELAELVKLGVKRATTGLYYFYELDSEALPQAGELNIIKDWKGKAQCIIATKKVDLLPFKDVTEEFARTEGEGDKSLNYWRAVHIDAFNRQLMAYGKGFREDMLVVCEEFERVYPVRNISCRAK